MAILKLLHIKERKTGNRAQGLKNALNYILNPDKTEDLLYTGGSHCPFISAELAYQKMMQTKNFFNSQNGRQGYHFILSFKPEENVEPELCKKIAEEFIKSCLDDYEAVYAVHTDQKHMHAHIVFNSVSYSTGLKYHYSKGQWRKDMMPVVNSICKKYNLSEIDLVDTNEKKENLRHDEWEARKKGKYTILSHIQHDIDELITIAGSYEEFIQLLKEKGYGLREGAERYRTLSVVPPGYEKAIRPSTSLGSAYTPEGIRKRIEDRLQSLDEPSEADWEDRRAGERADNHDSEKNREKKYRVIVIRKGSYHFAPGFKPYRLTYFQRSYLRYCRFFMRLKNSGHCYDSWKYSKDIAAAQKLLDCMGFMIRNNITDKAALEAYKNKIRYVPKTAKARKKLDIISGGSDHVTAFSMSQKKEKKENGGTKL